MGNFGYRGYLKSFGWRNKRFILLKSDHTPCFCCGAEKWKYATWRCLQCGEIFYGDKWSYNPVCVCGAENCEEFKKITSGSEFFHLHHLTYKNFGKELVEDLLVLCEDCHLLVHALINISDGRLTKRSAVEYVKNEKNRIFMAGIV